MGSEDGSEAEKLALFQRLLAEMAEHEKRLTALEDVDRIIEGMAQKRFIREAATRIYVQGMMIADKAPGVVTFSPQTCWRAAGELWAAKPEDC